MLTLRIHLPAWGKSINEALSGYTGVDLSARLVELASHGIPRWTAHQQLRTHTTAAQPSSRQPTNIKVNPNTPLGVFLSALPASHRRGAHFITLVHLALAEMANDTSSNKDDKNLHRPSTLPTRNVGLDPREMQDMAQTGSATKQPEHGESSPALKSNSKTKPLVLGNKLARSVATIGDEF